MTDKTKHAFLHPAPRPRSINDPGMTQALNEATRDLGFNRPTSAAVAEPARSPAVADVAQVDVTRLQPRTLASPAPRSLTSRPEPKPKAAKPAQAAPVDSFDDRSVSIRFAVDDALSTALKFEAVRRRVTVKYLILEALAAKDFPVDLANLPEDGRRLRK